MYINGFSNWSRGGVRLIITGPQDFQLAYALRFNFRGSNNEVEYMALITALKHAKILQIQHLTIFSDSQLVINQVNDKFEAKKSCML